MAFFMRVCSRQNPDLSSGLWQLVWLFCIGLLLPGPAQAGGFTIRSVETRQQDAVFLLDTRVNLAFSKEAQKALQSGIPIIILLDIEVEQLRSWWWNKTIARLQQGYLLLYHALTEKYIVNNLNSGAQHDYTSLGACLAATGHITGLPLIDSALLDKDEQYQLRLRVKLDIESLPAPMRPLAYISSDWQLASDWYTWPLQR